MSLLGNLAQKLSAMTSSSTPTPLSQAVRYGETSRVHALLATGANPNQGSARDYPHSADSARPLPIEDAVRNIIDGKLTDLTILKDLVAHKAKATQVCIELAMDAIYACAYPHPERPMMVPPRTIADRSPGSLAGPRSTPTIELVTQLTKAGADWWSHGADVEAFFIAAGHPSPLAGAPAAPARRSSGPS